MFAEYTRNIRRNASNRTIIYVYFVEHILPEIGINDHPQDSNIQKNYMKYSKIT
jgi:hypothetical protein